jgi:hypothetical protein
MKVLLVILSLILIIGIVNADTLILDADHDGYMLEESDAIFPIMRAAAGDSVVNSPSEYLPMGIISAASTTAIFDYNIRGGITFPTGALLPDNVIIDNATVRVFGHNKYDGLTSKIDAELVDFTPVGYIYAATDYSQTTLTPLAGNITWVNWGADSFFYFNLNTVGLTKVSTTANSSFMLTHSGDARNFNLSPLWKTGEATGFRYYSIAIISVIPRITIGYHLPDTTPPASITGLANITDCNSINWTFNKPGDVDYNGLMVWKNGTFLHNLSAAATNDLWLNLTELTSYTFSSKTFDALNNINTTFVNRTSITAKCPPGPLASFTSNVTCGLVPFRVQFNDTSYSSTNLTGWNWSFGDGNYSVTQNPVFEYNLSGMFAVSLNVTNAWGSNISQTSNYIRGVPNWASCPPTPMPSPTWQPEINPSTEMDLQPNWWWLIAGGMILFIWFIFRRSK